MGKVFFFGAVLAAGVAALAGASSSLKLRRYEIKTEKVSRKVKIAHISDLHESRFGKKQEALTDALCAIEPDAIFITGDIIEDGKNADPKSAPLLTDKNPAGVLLKRISKIAPCYMVLGNHECNIKNLDYLCREIEALGICLLHRNRKDELDARIKASFNSQDVLICGADDPYFDREGKTYKNKRLKVRIKEDIGSFDEVTEGWRERLLGEYGDIKDSECLTLLLSHRPEEYKLYRRLGFDAAFSGHAHGGQWRLPPFINGVYAPNQGIFPKHAGGVYRYGRHTHIVSRGLSKKRMIRIFNPPELCVAEFLPKKVGKGEKVSKR